MHMSPNRRAIDAPLTGGERLKIGVQLGSTMLAAGLLALGLWQKHTAPEMADVAQIILAMAALIVAFPIFVSAVRGLVVYDPHASIEQLVALAVLAAMVTGLFVTAALIAVIMNLGHFLEERSILGAQAAVEGLRKLHSGKATLLAGDEEREVPAESLKTGDLILVRPGDTLAADGDVLEGESAIDQSSITGESTPEDVAPGAKVFAGTSNVSGALTVRVTKTGSQTTLGRVVHLLREAEQSKPPVLKLIERYAGYYVPLLLTIAAVVLFINTRPPAPEETGADPTLSDFDVRFNAEAIKQAISILVVGCPGAFILAGPTAMIAALAAASRLGILIKNTRFMEALADVDTVVLDKTGTLTLGKLELVEIATLGAASKNDALWSAACLALGSKHPVARAVAAAARQARLTAGISASAKGLKEIAGKGMSLSREEGELLLGRREWLLEQGFQPPENPEHSGPVVWLARKLPNGQPAEVTACFLLADVARPEAKKALAELRELGMKRAVLLTGDRRAVAEHIGQGLGMSEIIAEVLPEQKLTAIQRERAAGRRVMMVGDGVNDALALSSGDVGIALGAAASDVALQSADVALMRDDLTRVPTTVRLARKTRAIINENVLIAAVASVGMVGLASVIVIPPFLAAVMHVIGELAVILNSGRLLDFGRR